MRLEKYYEQFGYNQTGAVNRHVWHLEVVRIVSEVIKGVCASATLKNTDLHLGPVQD